MEVILQFEFYEEKKKLYLYGSHLEFLDGPQSYKLISANEIC